MSIYNELPTAFPWYDKIEKQQRFRENAAKVCDYKLISPNTGLLPFEILLPASLPQPTKWEVYSLSGQVVDISRNIPLINGMVMEGGLYAFYKGEAMTFLPGYGTLAQPLKIPEGLHYSVLTFSNGTQYFSEIFTVVPDVTKYVKIEYWGSGDIEPLFYKLSNWRQVIYLDTFIHVAEPEIEEDGERDGTDSLIPTFQKMTVKYRLSILVPDYVKVALTSMQMHDNVYLTTENGNRSGKIERMTTTSTVENSGAYSTVDLLLEQLLLFKQSCSDEMVVVTANPWTL